MRWTNGIAIFWGFVAVTGALWLVRSNLSPPPAAPNPGMGSGRSESPRESGNETAAAPVGGDADRRSPAPAAGGPGLRGDRPEPGPEAAPEASPEPPESEAPAEWGGLPVDGDQLVAAGPAEVATLAGILQEAGVGPEVVRGQLRMTYGHVQRLRQFRRFAAEAEARVRAAREGRDQSVAQGDASVLSMMELIGQTQVERVAEYEEYLRRSLARDLAITNEAVVGRIFDFARQDPEPDQPPPSEVRLIPR